MYTKKIKKMIRTSYFKTTKISIVSFMFRRDMKQSTSLSIYSLASPLKPQNHPNKLFSISIRTI